MRELNDIIGDIRYECHSGITTRGNCVNGCQCSARGGGKCIICLQNELAKKCDDVELAHTFVLNTRLASQALSKIQQLVEASHEND